MPAESKTKRHHAKPGREVPKAAASPTAVVGPVPEAVALWKCREKGRALLPKTGQGG